MANYDFGGGCPCGLRKECDEMCEMNEKNQLISYAAKQALLSLIRLTKKERQMVLLRFEEILKSM